MNTVDLYPNRILASRIGDDFADQIAAQVGEDTDTPVDAAILDNAQWLAREAARIIAIALANPHLDTGPRATGTGMADRIERIATDLGLARIDLQAAIRNEIEENDR